MNARSLQRMVHVGCKALGLDEDTRHDLQLVATGKASMADMSEAELQKVVDALKAKGFAPGFAGKAKGRRPAPERADVRLIHVLWGQLGRAGKLKVEGRAGLNAFIRARFEKKWGSVPIDVDALKEWTQISDVIDALKDWCRREGIELR
jgi:phage gp16-like protein